MVMNKNFICLCNPHDGEWKLFEFEYGRDKYAPTYGTPIATGRTPEEAIETAKGWGIDPNDVDVVY